MKEVEIYLSVIQHNGKPAIQLRKILVEKEEVREFMREALEKESFPVKVCFKNKMLAAVRLKQIGLL